MSAENASLYEYIQDRVRYFNKYILNPLALSISGRPYSITSLLRHRGRRSGQTYETPVLAAKVGKTIYIPLPYGTGADWYQNVQAAGECTLLHQGLVYSAEQPELVPLEEGLSLFSAPIQALLRRNAEASGHDRLLRLKLSLSEQQVYELVKSQHPTERAVWGAAAAAALMVGLFITLRRLTRRR